MIGIDEVGRGCWAGPMLVIAARQNDVMPKEITDSKVLTKQKRLSLLEVITESCDLGEGWVEPGEIDKLGLTEATKLGVARALDALGAKKYEEIIIDGHINFCSPEYADVKTMIKADLQVPIVGAASIYAKVIRDTYMSQLPSKYKLYEFASHVGYGTKRHLEILQKYGVSDLHRKSYKPIRELMGV